MNEADKKNPRRGSEPDQVGDLGQGSFEQSQQAGKGISQSRQGPRQVKVPKDRR